MKKAFTVLFNALGIAGLLLMGLFIYLNEFASPDNVLHEYRLKLVLAFVVAVILHGAYLVSDAARRNKTVWLVLLIIAPIPVYWIYYCYYAVLQFRDGSGKKAHSLEQERWSQTLEAIESADKGNVTDSDETHRWLKSWGSDEEQDAPGPKK